MRVVGIDPGTMSFDLFGFENATQMVFLDQSISTKEIKQNPEVIVEILTSHLPLDLIIAPSGFGLPVKKIQDLSPQDIFEMTLRHPSTSNTMGLEAVIQSLMKTDLPVYTIPGIKHLSSIPLKRKVNRIDLGSADKLAVVVSILHSLIAKTQASLESISCIILEIGAGFSAIIAVEKGQIVDAIGGTNILGMQSPGALDGEVAYLLHDVEKKDIYSGGFQEISGLTENWDHFLQKIGDKELSDQFNKNVNLQLACEVFIDQISRSLHQIQLSFKQECSLETVPIYLSGRMVENPVINSTIQQLTHPFGEIHTLSKMGISKNAAQGSAFIADGLLCHFTQQQNLNYRIIHHLGIIEASGSILDALFFPKIKNFKI